jgi:hypothetical protein
LAGVLHLSTRVTEVRAIGTAAWRAQKQLLHGTVADDELERLRPARFVPKARSNRADLMSLVPPEAGCQGAVHNRAAVAAGRGRRCRPRKGRPPGGGSTGALDPSTAVEPDSAAVQSEAVSGSG